MVIIIAGASHVGKTFLAQKLLEKLHYPYLSIDHLKMGLIRSGATQLTPYDDEELTSYLWGIVKEIIKTAIENKQDLIIEGCYIPFDFRTSFSKDYLDNIKFIALAFSSNYINKHFDDIIKYGNVIENRIIEDDITIEKLIKDNEEVINGFNKYHEKVFIIDNNYEEAINEILEKL